MYVCMYVCNWLVVLIWLFLRESVYNVSGWHEAGFGVYFSYADLEKQGKLSNDHRKDGKWARVSEDIMWIARKYRQVCMYVCMSTSKLVPTICNLQYVYICACMYLCMNGWVCMYVLYVFMYEVRCLLLFNTTHSWSANLYSELIFLPFIHTESITYAHLTHVVM